MWLGIDWLAFIIVSISSLTAAVVVVSLYALGIRLSALADPLPPDIDPDTPEHEIISDTGTIIVVKPLTLRQRNWARLGAKVCFGLSAFAVLLGIFLIIPVLHSMFW